MKFKLGNHIYFDETLNKYVMTADQQVRDEVEKDHWKTVGKTLIKDWRLYVMLIPMLFVFICWRYLPMYELLASFKHPTFGNPLTVADQYYIGFTNFYDVMFGAQYSGLFWSAFRNTFVISFYGLLFGFPFPIILALFFNEIKSDGYRSILQVLAYLPKFISTVIVTSIIILLISGKKEGGDPGLITQALQAIYNATGSGKDITTGLLRVPDYFRTIFTMTGIWEGAGYGSIVYFAAIIAVSPTSYEAAQIDGANKMQQMRFIVLPAILSTIVIMLIVRIGTLLSVGYEQVILFQDSVGDPSAIKVTGEVVSTLALSWRSTNERLATVPEFLNNLTSMLLVIGANVISKKASGTSLY